jgi:hypothetical protein
MNEKFTPGPWNIRDNNTQQIVVYCEQDYPRINRCIARVERFNQCNASLIAAAPEMYEALSALVENYGYCIDDEDMTLAKQSLAKARGEK